MISVALCGRIKPIINMAGGRKQAGHGYEYSSHDDQVGSALTRFRLGSDDRGFDGFDVLS